MPKIPKNTLKTGTVSSAPPKGLGISFAVWRHGSVPFELSVFWNEENGQDMVEYTLLIGFMALAGAGVLSGVRHEMISVWQGISAGFSNAAS